MHLTWRIRGKLHPEGASGNEINTSSDCLKCQVFSKSLGVINKDPNSALLTTFLNKIYSDTATTQSSHVLFIGTNLSTFLEL